MNKNILAVGITILFLITTITPMAFGHNVKISKTATNEIYDSILEDITSIPLKSYVFSQRPFEPNENWIFRKSDASTGFRVWDEYWEVNEPLCGIRWWGVSVDNQSNICDPEGMVFEIIFWDGLLGNPVCIYNVSPPVVATGKFYAGLEMFEWETELEPCCDLIPIGWVTIQSISSPNQCMFYWAGSEDGDLYCYHEGESNPDQTSDSAFELISDWETPISKISCDPVGPFPEKVPPGFKTSFQIFVCNCGESGSWLNWYVDEKTIPNWGNWTFWRYNGTYVAEGDCDIIDVDFIAPEEEGSYRAKLKICNKDDNSDYCTLDFEVNVPRTRTTSYHWLLERFPMLERLLNLIR